MSEQRRHWWQRRETRNPLPEPPARTDRLTFDLVRRGYDCAQVDAHLALPPARRPHPAAFDLARRGYDRAQVDRALAAGA
ncbi:hypothetical protein AB0O31_15290 [Kitasatospora cineracea]|uniref:hypothetical protein n=1 Tax=Kitasatospora cineracea TaxID=88074 RepID=UPI00342283DD